MAEEYSNFLKKSLDLKSAREERNKDLSRDKLFKAAKKKNTNNHDRVSFDTRSKFWVFVGF